MTRLGILLVMVAMIGGCTIGKPGWRGPGGGAFEYDVTDSPAGGRGELIAVRDSTVVVLHPIAGVEVVLWRLLGSSSLVTPTRIRLSPFQTPSRDQLRLLRYYSRYPNGITDDELVRLIEATRPQRATMNHLGHGPTLPLDSATTVFLLRAREAGDVLMDPAAAIARGYRVLGPDFVGMGEHWVHLGLAISPTVDPARPALLSYASLDGRVQLVSVAYAVPLAPGEDPPRVPGLPPEAWHDHSSSVDEETLIVSAPATHAITGSEPRVAMAHVWLWLENPDGVFAQNNWTLAFRRIGVAAPTGVGPAAARALALADSAGSHLHRDLVRRLAASPGSFDRAASEIVARHGERAARVADRLRAAGVATDVDVAELVVLWESLGEELGRALPQGPRDRVTAFHRSTH